MISVIVPIYKVEQYLSRCVDSIITQTYKDIEIILVNDGSPDRCGQICDEYAQEDARVRVVHKVNGGLSDARNAGLEIAKGEYVTFIDSDDFVALNMLEHLVNRLIQYDAGIVQCEHLRVYKDSMVQDTTLKINQPTSSSLRGTASGNEAGCGNLDVGMSNEEDVVMTGLEAMESCLTEHCHVKVNTWAKLYRRDLFIDNDIRFPVGRIHEDNFTTYKLCYFAKTVVCSSNCLYFYLIREDSIMEKPFSLERLDVVKAAKEALDFVKNHNVPLEKQVNAYYILACVTGINRILMSNTWKQHRGVLSELRLGIKKKIPHAIINRYALKKTRIHLILLWFGYWLYIPVMRLWWILSGTAEG